MKFYIALTLLKQVQWSNKIDIVYNFQKLSERKTFIKAPLKGFKICYIILLGSFENFLSTFIYKNEYTKFNICQPDCQFNELNHSSSVAAWKDMKIRGSM